jgi:hypothetical protein
VRRRIEEGDPVVTTDGVIDRRCGERIGEREAVYMTRVPERSIRRGVNWDG